MRPYGKGGGKTRASTREMSVFLILILAGKMEMRAHITKNTQARAESRELKGQSGRRED